MNHRQLSFPTSALPARPDRPIKYVLPVSAPDGSVGYDRPLENYFDASMAPCLLPPVRPARLYETIALAHDYRFQVTPDMIDPSWSTPRPLVLNQRERSRSLAYLGGNSTDYMGISPEVPEWRPRRSSYEDRRGAVGVTPSEVNTLVPYIPPIDTSLPPPSREWLDAMAKQFLADAHADFQDAHRNPTTDVTGPQASHTEDVDFFDYDTDTTLDDAVTASSVSVPQPPQQAPQAESESCSSTDTDMDSDTDTDSDTSSDDGYDWNTTPSAPLDSSPWIIPRRRPSVVTAGKEDATASTSPSSSDDERMGKRRRGGKTAPYRPAAKKSKRYANDTPTEHGGKSTRVRHISESPQDILSECPHTHASSLGDGTTATLPPLASSVTATTLQMKHVRIASPCTASPQPDATSVPPKPSKVYPCRLGGCNQICSSAGDLQRHRQSLRHRAPSHGCLACGKSYTRSDALKRHLNSKATCKQEHSTKATSYGSNPDASQNGSEYGGGASRASSPTSPS